eukprot:UN08294
MQQYSANEIDKWEDDCEEINDEMNEVEQKEVEYYCYCSHAQDYLSHLEKKAGGHGTSNDDEQDDGLTPQQRLEKQESFHKWAGFGTLLLGTALILIFSDPLIEIVTHVGVSSGVPAFYISFCLLPFVSNSSELITSLVF